MQQKTKRELQMWVEMGKETIIDYHHTKLVGSRVVSADEEVASDVEIKEVKSDNEPDVDELYPEDEDDNADAIFHDEVAETTSDPKDLDTQVMILNLHQSISKLKAKMLANQKLVLTDQSFLEQRKIRDDQDALEKDIVVKVRDLGIRL